MSEREPDGRRAGRGRWTLSAESITAASAVVAALVALAVGVWENVQMREHNRLSVVPHLDFTFQVTDQAADSVRGSLLLVNEGVGPAVVQEVRIRVRGEDGRVREFGTWSEALSAVEALGVAVGTRAEISEGVMMGAGRRLEMLGVRPDASGGGRRELLRLLERLEVEVAYRSVYGDAFRVTFDGV